MIAKPGYVLDNAWTGEEQRLAALTSLFDSGTEDLLRRLGVREGWRCMEVGAGSGSIARWLSEQVGRSGSVLALDLDVRFLRGIEAPNFEVRQGDVHTADLSP